ncbi:hypothetical protein TanjilG_07169 [Lupinus angustifolius]|uniref:Uncharacterized protein n=1 Tax=Lupinus angustifolius TaxID=3871 RepID=A0A1J7FNW5_LUPAN|nr:hypothetical protein TanjilG_07169 [Lupinus angustifolius]
MSHYMNYLWEYGVTPNKKRMDVSKNNNNKETKLDLTESRACNGHLTVQGG